MKLNGFTGTLERSCCRPFGQTRQETVESFCGLTKQKWTQPIGAPDSHLMEQIVFFWAMESGMTFGAQNPDLLFANSMSKSCIQRNVFWIACMYCIYMLLCGLPPIQLHYAASCRSINQQKYSRHVETYEKLSNNMIKIVLDIFVILYSYNS